MHSYDKWVKKKTNKPTNPKNTSRERERESESLKENNSVRVSSIRGRDKKLFCVITNEQDLLENFIQKNSVNFFLKSVEIGKLNFEMDRRFLWERIEYKDNAKS